MRTNLSFLNSWKASFNNLIGKLELDSASLRLGKVTGFCNDIVRIIIIIIIIIITGSPSW
jgi:hypothetical protein